jgi:pimeloyl-ACP methyl ester carboxylesterase
VYTRGDLEILTYETEEDYDRLQQLLRETENAQPERGKETTLYLRSRTDGSVQPYGVWLPPDFSRTRTWPLVVQLHGLNFREVLSGARVRYRGMGGPQWVEPDLPVIYAHCFGRPSAFYRGMGEQDVLEVIDEIKQRLPIDSDRVYIMGHSMGGSGSYTIGLHYPDLFGGITPVDAAMWVKNAPPEPAAAPEWMKPQIAIHWPDRLYPNARNVDVFFKNAGAGIQRDSTEFTDGILAEGGFSTMELFPGMEHNFGDKYPYADFVTELIRHPIRRHPAEVKFYTNSLRYNRAYWVTIDRLTRHNADARIVAAWDGKDALRVTTSNIDALTLRLEDTPAPKGAAASLIVDAAAVITGPLPPVAHLAKSGGDWRQGEWPAARAKRHGLQGPIDDAFNSRFLAVYGEGNRELAIAELDAIRNPPGPLDIHGDFPMKAAAKVTRADVESSNLILFGTPVTNPVLKRIAARLPAALLREADGARSIFIYPNPENPDRYVVVWQAKLLSGSQPLHWGWIMPLCLLPDWVRVKEEKVVSGGHFDSDWGMRE